MSNVNDIKDLAVQTLKKMDGVGYPQDSENSWDLDFRVTKLTETLHGVVIHVMHYSEYGTSDHAKAYRIKVEVEEL